ncbi:MAG: hypothetical protein WAM59_00875, partial [Candidatus Acidiferrales bacterium]
LHSGDGFGKNCRRVRAPFGVSQAHFDPISEQEVHPFAGGWSSVSRTRRQAVHRSGTAPLGVWGNYRRKFPSSL